MQVFPRSSLMGQGRESHAELLLFTALSLSHLGYIHMEKGHPIFLPACFFLPILGKIVFLST